MNAACITTYNERATIKGLVSALRSDKLFDSVVLADAGSSDGTVQAAQTVCSQVFIFRSPRRECIARCMLQAWHCALLLGGTKIVQLDAGGSHSGSEAASVLDALTVYHMVIGSRFLSGSEFVGSHYRRWRSRSLTRLTNLLSGRNFSDWTSGLRGFRAELLRELMKVPYRCHMHCWQIEVLQAALKLGAKIGEVPISYHAGRSSAHRALLELPGCLIRLLHDS